MDYLKEINEKYPIRKTEEQKESFRKYVLEKASEKGIDARVEKLDKHNNVVIGNPIMAKTVFTAHYDTPCASPFPNLMMRTNKGLFYLYQFAIIFVFLAIALIPAIVIGMGILNSELAYAGIFLTLYFGLFILCFKAFTNKNNANDNTSGVATILTLIEKLSKDQLEKVAFILFDNEEKGKKGSAAYFKDHKDEMKERFLINFDCVGNGENIIFIAQEGAINSQEFKQLKGTFENSDEFTLDFCTHKEAQSNSDHKNFPCGVACIACKKSKNGILYTPNIHTNKDVIAYNSNIDYIAKNIVLFIDNI
jgi:hypothetical protein